MGLPEIIAAVKGEYIFALLFITCLIGVAKWVVAFIKEQKEDSKAREQQLLADNNEREEKIHSIYEKSLQDATKREDKLMKHLDKNTNQLERITDTQVQIQDSLKKLENRVEQIEGWQVGEGSADSLPKQ
ncbi:hypothetical protein YTCETSXE_CDS0088 [Staphylococcus phage MVC_VPHSA2]|nr:hypothetical protein YTCETSXE_CDS0088 [Staphylococcus phage MVC_VPHSA2]